MNSHWSLVTFTLLVQATAGSLWTMPVIILAIPEPLASDYIKYYISALLVLIVISLITALAHLGKPLHSINSVRNIGQSWLSKEIVCVNMFAGVLAALDIIIFLMPDFSQLFLILSGSVVGGLTLYTMTNVYLIRTVPAWNHIGTPLTFAGSALLLGGVLNIIQLNAFHRLVNIDFSVLQAACLMRVSVSFIFLGFLLKILASLAETVRQAKVILPILQLCGVTLLTMTLLVGTNLRDMSYVLYFPSILIITGKYLNRSKFYQNYRRVGL